MKLRLNHFPARRWIQLAIACGLMAGGAVQAGMSVAQVDQGRTAVQDAGTDRLIVKYRDASREQLQGGERFHTAAALPAGLLEARLQKAQQLAAGRGMQMRLVRQAGSGAHVLKLNRRLSVAEMRAFGEQLRQADSSIEYVEPDRRMHVMFVPNDSSYASQWDLGNTGSGIRAPAAWDLATGTGVVVAVIDTGIRPHADLSGQTVAGYDMIIDTAVSNDGTARDGDPSDPGDWTAAGECGTGSTASNSSWHGTHVAGTIAAKTNNSAGIAGIAFNAKVQAVRALGKCGGYTSDIADGIIWASGGTVSGVPANATPAKVINMSLGGAGACDTTTQNAINGARARGTSVIVAAGNENQNASNSSPANCAGVVTVAAVDRNGARAYYSNYGANVTLAAPGGDTRSSASNGILSTLNAGTTSPGADSYAYYQGTSMATPHVAGVAALLYSAKPSATPDEIKTALTSSSRAFTGTCSQCGAGMLDAEAAVRAITGGTLPSASEIESNNTTASANVVNSPLIVNGSIASTTDTDYFKVTLPAGKTLTATLNATSTANDFDLTLRNSAGTSIATSVNGAGAADTITYANGGSASITLYVQVVRYSGTGTYTLKLQW